MKHFSQQSEEISKSYLHDSSHVNTANIINIDHFLFDAPAKDKQLTVEHSYQSVLKDEG